MSRASGRRRDWLLPALTMLVLGALGGVVWWVVATPAEYVRQDGQVVMTQLELSRRFAADGWYVVIGLLAGLIPALVLMMRRHADPLVTVISGLLGALAAAWVARWVGGALGQDPAQMKALAEALKEGQTLPVPLTLTWAWEVLAWPLGWLLGAVGVLFATPVAEPEEEFSAPSTRP